MAEKLEAIIEDEEVDAIANKDAKARSTSTSNDAELEDELSSRFNETEKVMSSSSTDEHVEKPIQDPAVEAFTSDPSLVDGARFATKPESNSTPTTPSSSSTEEESMDQKTDESMSPRSISSVAGSVNSGSSPEIDSDMPVRRAVNHAVNLKSLAKSGRSLTGRLESVKMDEEMPDVAEPILTNSPPPSLGGSEHSTPALDVKSESYISGDDDDDYEPGASPTFGTAAKGKGEEDEEDAEDEEDEEDEEYEESDEGEGLVRRSSLHRPSGARAVLRPKNENGEDLSEQNCKALEGKHILVKRTMSTAMQPGVVLSLIHI